VLLNRRQLEILLALASYGLSNVDELNEALASEQEGCLTVQGRTFPVLNEAELTAMLSQLASTWSLVYPVSAQP